MEEKKKKIVERLKIKINLISIQKDVLNKKEMDNLLGGSVGDCPVVQCGLKSAPAEMSTAD